MNSSELLTRLPVVPIAVALIALMAVIVYGTYALYMKSRARNGIVGQIVLYALLVFLFSVDLFLFLRRDGFRASWSLTFWLVLAAFIFGERVGRWTSSFSASQTLERKDLR